MTTPSSSSLSHALNPPTVIQKPLTELPRLQLAPPEHHKHLQTQAQAQARQQQQQESTQPTSSISPATQRRSDERATSLSSSREVSPAVGVETTQSATGDKRKSATGASKNTSSKKRRTDQAPQEEVRDVPLQYGLGTHYPYTYAYPGAPPPPPLPAFHPPPAPNPNAEMGFNEFQWRLLNLCGEFYEAATELIRATPHLVLSQAFQLLNRGTGMDPISVLNDARRTCDMMLANPQALATAPPPPTALPLPVLTSLAHLNSRASVTAASAAPVAAPSYYQPQLPQDHTASGDKSSHKGKEKERTQNNVQGTWKDHEVQRLKALAEKYRVRDKTAIAEEEEEEEEDAEDGEGVPEGGESSTQPPKKVKELGDVDWDKVVAEFGDERSRHQVLIKATYLGLKPSSSVPGKKPKKKKQVMTSVEPPPPTFSSASAKSIPVGYSSSQLGATQSPSASPGTTSSPTGATAPQPPPVASTSTNANSSADSQRAAVPHVPPQHPHPHAQYAQPGWYPHPQNPYYAYHQPMYYSTHPQGYGMQTYGMHTPPQQGYYGQSYPPPSGTDTPAAEKQPAGKGKRKEPKKSNGPASGASTTPVPPPSLPPKAATAESAKSISTPGGAPLSSDAQGSAGSTPRATPAVPPATLGTASTATGSSGVLRRGPNNSLFTYTPLPHGPGGTSTEQSK